MGKSTEKITLTDGRTLTILNKIGEGGQGKVYRVRINETNEEKALKWYFLKRITEPKKFYEHLANNIKIGSPSSAFIWPEQLTTKSQYNSFGYIMKLIPKQYVSFSSFLTGQTYFDSTIALISAALHIVNAFCELHNKGFNYQDLNDGNFVINPHTGDVLICDNDNVMGQGQFSGICGKARYMAPEIVRGDARPNKSTDRFSLAIVLFLLLIGDHPLEGKGTRSVILTNSLDKKFFGNEPIFIYDENNISNRPVPELHRNAVANWKYFPSYIKKAFQKSFSYESMLKSSGRLTEQSWLHLLMRLRASAVECPYCQEMIFLEPAPTTICPTCHNTIKSPGLLHFPSRGNTTIDIPIYPGVHLYEYHIGSNEKGYDNLVATIVSKQDKYGLRNESAYTWNVSNVIGKTAQRLPKDVVTLRDGFMINFCQNSDIAQVILYKN